MDRLVALIREQARFLPPEALKLPAQPFGCGVGEHRLAHRDLKIALAPASIQLRGNHEHNSHDDDGRLPARTGSCSLQIMPTTMAFAFSAIFMARCRDADINRAVRGKRCAPLW